MSYLTTKLGGEGAIMVRLGGGVIMVKLGGGW